MVRRDAGRTGPRSLVVAVVLVLFAISGLGAGFATRTVLDALSGGGQARGPTATPAATSAQSPTPSPTPTASLLLGPSHFTFTVAVAPRTVVPGQAFTISATLVAADGVTPVANTTCYLRAPDASVPLYTPWPSPVRSDAAGQAIWSLIAPQIAPGTYRIEVYAFGEHGWSFHFNTSVTVQT